MLINYGITCVRLSICYFCGMHFSDRRPIYILLRLTIVLTAVLLYSCEGLWQENVDKQPLARVGKTYLYKNDVTALMGDNIPKEDSASFVINYINNWATRQLLLDKAKINLSEEKLAEFDQLVANYRTDLYTRAYKEALVERAEDTSVSVSQLENFYENEKHNFRLKEKIVRLRFIELPKRFLNKKEVTSKLKRFKEEDAIYLDSIGVYFTKLNFNDKIWITASRAIEEIGPLTYDNADRYLKKSQFFELEDDNGVYLVKVTDVLKVNDIAPLPYIEPTIKQVLLNRRKLDYIRKLETELIDEATKEKEFEVYESKE